MNTIFSLWLGIAFLVLGVAAVIIQAILWNPDKYWDPVKKKTNAPRLWLGVHRVIGYAFGAIYLVMMWHMVPRLWEYQVELPARTIIHATAAILLGVLLITKIVILKWFRYFEESMPQLGLGILACTVLISVLSIPYAVRGTGLVAKSLDPENRERISRVLSDIKFENAVPVPELVSDKGLRKGREVLAQECVRCHDMRTILAKPRSGANWHQVIVRMLDKPTIFDKPLDPKDVPYVTAFMISITPDIQGSRKAKLAQADEAKIAESKMDAKLSDGNDPESEVKTPELPTEQAKALYEKRCIDCHEHKEVLDRGGDTEEGWAQVVRRMVVEEEAVINAIEGIQIARYLAATYPAGTKAPAVAQAPKTQPAVLKSANSAQTPESSAVASAAVAPVKVALAPKPATSAAAGTPETAAVAPVATTAAPAKPAAPVVTYTGPAPCRATSFSTSTVRSACARGGQPEARSLMRAFVNRGKTKDLEFKCSSCHTDQSSYGLTGNALADLRKLM